MSVIRQTNKWVSVIDCYWVEFERFAPFSVSKSISSPFSRVPGNLKYFDLHSFADGSNYFSVVFAVFCSCYILHEVHFCCVSEGHVNQGSVTILRRTIERDTKARLIFSGHVAGWKRNAGSGILDRKGLLRCRLFQQTRDGCSKFPQNSHYIAILSLGRLWVIRYFAKPELAYGLAKGGQMDSEIDSQVQKVVNFMHTIG